MSIDFYFYLPIASFSCAVSLLIPWDAFIRPTLKKCYRNLYNRLTELARGGVPGKELSTTSYKGLDKLLELILELSRNFGSSPQKHLLDLREKLVNDYQFECKKRDLRNSAIAQFVVIVLLGWGLLWVAQWQLEIRPSWSKMFPIVLWQLLGLGVFSIVSGLLQKKLLSSLERLYQVLSTLELLLATPLSLAELAKHAKVNSLELCEDSELEWFIERLHQALGEARSSGVVLKQEVSSLTLELQYLEKQRMEKVRQYLTVLKLGVTLIFFVVSYFFFMLQMVSEMFSHSGTFS